MLATPPQKLFIKREDPVLGCLSNYFYRPFKYNRNGPMNMNADDEWPTAEHALQATKFPVGSTEYNAIRNAVSPDLAYTIGNFPSPNLIADWEEKRLQIMSHILFAKFQQNPDLQDRLLSTENNILIVSSDDSFWGSGPIGANGSFTGLNKLGGILMGTRNMLRQITR